MFKVRKLFGFKISFVSALLAIVSLTFSPAANSDTGYRYWGYFQAAPNATNWTAAMTGPSVELEDGAVEGWAFVFSNSDIPAIEPMMDPDFATLCGETPQTAGKIRVGLVVDFGSGSIAPEGETPLEFFSDCVVVPEGSIGLDVLQSALDVQAGESGLICGIAGYPANECGAEIEAPVEEAVTTAAATDPISASNDSDSRNMNSILLAALALMILAGFAINRKRTK